MIQIVMDASDLVRERIRKARVESGLTQEQLAESIGVTTQAFSTWERGTRQPRFNDIQKISEVSKKPLYWFFQDPKTSINPEMRETLVALQRTKKEIAEFEKQVAQAQALAYRAAESAPAVNDRPLETGSILQLIESDPYLDEKARNLVHQTYQFARQDTPVPLPDRVGESSGSYRLNTALKPLEMVEFLELKAAGWAAWKIEDLWALQRSLTRFSKERGIAKMDLEWHIRASNDIDDETREMLLAILKVAKRRRPVVEPEPAPAEGGPKGKSFWVAGDIVEHPDHGLGEVSVVGPVGACPDQHVQVAFDEMMGVYHEAELTPHTLKRGKKVVKAEVWEVLLRARTQAGWRKRSDFAAHARFSEKVLRQLETGKALPDENTLGKLVAAVGVRYEPMIKAAYPLFEEADAAREVRVARDHHDAEVKQRAV